MSFEKFNNNPLGKKTSDCVIRSLSKATGLSWISVFERLVNIARDLKVTPESMEAVRKFLENEESITTVIDGVNYDTWDCGNKSAYKIWKVK